MTITQCGSCEINVHSGDLITKCSIISQTGFISAPLSILHIFDSILKTTLGLKSTVKKILLVFTKNKCTDLHLCMICIYAYIYDLKIPIATTHMARTYVLYSNTRQIFLMWIVLFPEHSMVGLSGSVVVLCGFPARKEKIFLSLQSASLEELPG